ncbi:hypothetical protein EDD16DRAFT_1497128 [Pisolithus croceorrhizus]|nr:hypothetical protein EDD16DRAFT_1497128 [Pisolithus croceorrhizus]KAI6165641.1 hypothetical protein EDD17DRAFT_1472166 [Pisolithus thermaeus]
MVNPPIVVITLHTFLLLAGMPQGIYGISYDISTPQTERDLPHGWNARRAQTYRQLACRLECGQFTQLQRSDWVRENTDTITTYYTMLMLGDITPPGKLSSMVKGLKMHMIHHWLLDVTQDIQLGRQYATMLVGPTPSGLVPANVPSIEAPEDFVVPAYTRHSDAALDVANWRV